MPLPRLSVIVLTWNEEANIAACLRSLANQTVQEFEVIVIDAGSTDATLREIADVTTGLPFGLRLHVGPPRMPIGEARNLGVTLSVAPAVAFLSADAELDSDWVGQALRSLEKAQMVFGPQVHAPHRWTVGASVRGLRYNFPADEVADALPHASNVAAAYAREVLVRFPFDPWANAAEDLLLARRAQNAGFVAAYNPRMTARHHDVSSWRQELRKNVREGHGCGAYASELGIQWPMLAWLLLMAGAALVAGFAPLLGIPVLALSIWLPSLRRVWRRRNAMPPAALALGLAVSPAFDLVFLAQYVRGLFAGRWRRRRAAAEMEP